ncbi:MAG: ABC transporter permease [Betaproteobacteria bacterium]|nr:ABC transporter permease [Betaproteobacteria bacterium]
MIRAIGGALLPCAALIAWELASQFGAVPEYLPPPTAIAAALWELIRSGELLDHVGVSLLRVAVGLVTGVAAGVSAGLAAGMFVLAQAVFSPLVSLLNPIPKIAFLPLIIVALGLGHGSKIAAIAVSVFFPAFISSFYAVRSVPQAYVWSASSMGAGRLRVFFRVLLPASLPMIFAGLRVALGLSFIVLFAAELLGSQAGLGFLLVRAESSVRFDAMFSAIVVFALLGFVSDRLLLAVRKRVLRGQLIGKQGAEV